MLASQSDGDFKITFWGVRGSVPCCGTAFAGYGGNTSCVEVTCGDTRLILDAGSGLRNLGHVMREKGDKDAFLFLSHFHLDHVIGLPFFDPLYDKTSRFQLLAGHQGTTCCLKNAMSRLLSPPLMPVRVDTFKAKIDFRDIAPGGNVALTDRIEVRSAPLNHPGGALGYRIDYKGHSVCYVTDTEHMPGKPDKNILGLIEGADVFIYDTMYTDEEFGRFIGFGHSTYEEGLRLAQAAGVKTFVPFHYHPNLDDDALGNLLGKLEEIGSVIVPSRESDTLVIA